MPYATWLVENDRFEEAQDGTLVITVPSKDFKYCMNYTIIMSACNQPLLHVHVVLRLGTYVYTYKWFCLSGLRFPEQAMGLLPLRFRIVILLNFSCTCTCSSEPCWKAEWSCQFAQASRRECRDREQVHVWQTVCAKCSMGRKFHSACNFYRFGDAGYYYWILCKTSLEAAKKECHGTRTCTCTNIY